MGFGHEKPGGAAVLLCSAARFERCSESQVPYSIGIPIPTPTPIRTLI
jgi:hypothetical protein